MFNASDDTKPQSISHTVIAIDPSDLGDSASYDDFAALSKDVRESGGRVPGAKRLHPAKIDEQEFNLADAVANDLQQWSEKLGVGALI